MKFQQLLWFLANAFVSGIPKLGSLAHNPTNDQAHELKSTSCLVQILRRSNDDAHFCLSAAPFSFLKTLQAKVSKWVAVVYIYSYPFFFQRARLDTQRKEWYRTSYSLWIFSITFSHHLYHATPMTFVCQAVTKGEEMKNDPLHFLRRHLLFFKHLVLGSVCHIVQ